MIITDLDYSMLSAYCRCPRYFYYRYLMELVPLKKDVVPGAAEFGGAIHEALDIAYQVLFLSEDQRKKLFSECFRGAEYSPNRFNILPYAMAYSTFEEIWGETKSKGYTKDLGLSILREYFERYKTLDFEIIDVESKGAVPVYILGDKTIFLRYKSDLIIRQGGKYKVMEHKTTSRITPDYRSMRELEFQVDGYALGVEFITGIRVQEAIFNILAVKAGNSEKFLRFPVILNFQRRKLYEEWLRKTIQELVDLQRKLLDLSSGEKSSSIEELTWNLWKKGKNPHNIFRRNPSSCGKYNMLCRYAQLCLNDVHPGAVATFGRTSWKPYMDKGEEDK